MKTKRRYAITRTNHRDSGQAQHYSVVRIDTTTLSRHPSIATARAALELIILLDPKGILTTPQYPASED